MIPLITAQTVAFWVFAPIAVLAAVFLVLARKPVHCALALATVMLSLAGLYAALNAPFLFVAQIIVYTGAVLMLFVFTMMIVGVDSVDQMVETIRGQRFTSLLAVAGFAVLMGLAVGRGIVNPVAGEMDGNGAGNVPGLASLVFGRYFFAFEATAALLITAALAAMVLAHGEQLKRKERQAERVLRRTQDFATKGADPGPLPSAGVFARHNSIEYPALLPDGSVAQNSLSPTLVARGVVVVDTDTLKRPTMLAHREIRSVQEEMLGDQLGPDVVTRDGLTANTPTADRTNELISGQVGSANARRAAAEPAQHELDEVESGHGDDDDQDGAK